MENVHTNRKNWQKMFTFWWIMWKFYVEKNWVPNGLTDYNPLQWSPLCPGPRAPSPPPLMHLIESWFPVSSPDKIPYLNHSLPPPPLGNSDGRHLDRHRSHRPEFMKIRMIRIIIIMVIRMIRIIRILIIRMIRIIRIMIIRIIRNIIIMIITSLPFIIIAY